MQSLLGTKAVAAPETQPAASPPLQPPEDDPVLRKTGLDRLRLLLVYKFSQEKVRHEDVEELKNILSVTFPDLNLSALEHRKPGSTLSVMPYEEVKSGISGIFSSKSSTNCVGMALGGIGIVKELMGADKVRQPNP